MNGFKLISWLISWYIKKICKSIFIELFSSMFALFWISFNMKGYGGHVLFCGNWPLNCVYKLCRRIFLLIVDSTDTYCPALHTAICMTNMDSNDCYIATVIGWITYNIFLPEMHIKTEWSCRISCQCNKRKDTKENTEKNQYKYICSWFQLIE